MKLDEIILLQQVIQKEISTAKERVKYFGNLIYSKEKQRDDSDDEEEIECIDEELESIMSEMREARLYVTRLNNIEKEISERDFSII